MTRFPKNLNQALYDTLKLKGWEDVCAYLKSHPSDLHLFVSAIEHDTTWVSDAPLRGREIIEIALEIDAAQETIFPKIAHIAQSLLHARQTRVLAEICEESSSFTQLIDPETGDTLLHLALRARNQEMAERLIGVHQGSEILHLANKEGQTPYQLAHEWADSHAQGKEVLDLLADYGVAPATGEEAPVSLADCVDAKHMAHLFGDSFAKGMLDEGGRSVEGAKMEDMFYFLESLLQKATDEPSEEIQQALKQLRECRKIAEKISLIRTLPKEARILDMQRLAKRISHRIRYLRAGESILLPGGWMNRMVGHAMLYEVRRLSDGKYQLRLINAGGGIRWHQGIFSPNKEYRASTLTFSGLSREAVSNATWIEEALEMQVFSKREKKDFYSAKDLYDGVFSRFRGNALTEEIASSEMITAQRMGSCTAACWMACFRNQVGLEAYKDNRFLMEKAFFAVAEEQLKNGKILSEPERKILQFGVKHFIHSVWKLRKARVEEKRGRGTDPLLTEEEASAGVEQGQRVLKLLEMQAQEPTSKHPDLDVSAPPPLFAGEIEELAGIEESELDLAVPEGSDVPKVQYPVVDVGAGPESVVPYIEALVKTSRDLREIGQGGVAVQLIKQTLIELPLPGTFGFWEKLTDAEREPLIKALGDLAYEWMDALKETPVVHADRLIAFYKIQAIAYGVAIEMEAFQALRDLGPACEPLEFLRDHMENVTYTAESEQELKTVLTYFRDQQAAEGEGKPQLFAYSRWNRDHGSLILPIPHDSGEYRYLGGLYASIEETDWEQADADYEELDDRIRAQVSKKDYRLACLWAENKKESFDPFYVLRDLSLLGGLLDESVEETLEKVPVREAGQMRIGLDLFLVFRRDPCLLLVSFIEMWEGFSTKRPIRAGNLDRNKRRVIVLNNKTHREWQSSPAKIAWENKQKQNASILNRNTSFDQLPYEQIIQEDILAIHHLKRWLSRGVKPLFDSDNRVFCQLVLFRGSRLLQSLEKTPQLANQLLDAIEKNLVEVAFLIKESEKDPEILENIQQVELFLYQTKLRLLDHFRAAKIEGIEVEKEIQKLRTELEKREKGAEGFYRHALAVTLAASYRTFAPKGEEELLKMAVSLFRMQDDQGKRRLVDPSIRESADSVPFSAFTHLQGKLETLPGTFLNSLLKEVYGISLPAEATWEGEYPHFLCVTPKHRYQVDFGACQIARDGVHLTGLSGIYQMSVYRHVFGERRFLACTAHRLGNSRVKYEVDDEKGGSIRFYMGETLQIEREIDGCTYQALAKEKFPTKPLLFPFTHHPADENYLIWVSRDGESPHIRVEERLTGKFLGTVEATGKIHFAEEPEPRQRIDSKAWEGGRCFRKFDTSQTVFAHQDSSGKVTVEMLRYQRSPGKSLSFIQREDGRFVWRQDPQFIVAEKQEIKGISGLKNFLVIENSKGEKKVIIPLKAGSARHSKNFKTPPYKFSYEVFDLSEVGVLQTKTSRQHFFAAYLFLIHAEPEQAFVFLKKGYSLRRYTAEELKVLGWVLHSLEETEDYLPDSIAVRAFSGWLGQDNLLRFPTVQTEGPEVVLMSRFQDPKDWEAYWEGRGVWKAKNITIFQQIGESYQRYLNIRKNVPLALRIDASKSGTHFLKTYEEIRWLERLLKAPLTREPQEQLIRRLDFLKTGVWEKEAYTHPYGLVPPEFSPALAPWQERSAIPRQKVSVPSDAMHIIRHFFPKVRPTGDQLSPHFFDFLLVAERGTAVEKKVLENFLNGMRFSPDPFLQTQCTLLRYVLEEKMGSYWLCMNLRELARVSDEERDKRIQSFQSTVNRYWCVEMQDEPKMDTEPVVEAPDLLELTETSEPSLEWELDPAKRRDYLEACDLGKEAYTKVAFETEHRELPPYHPDGVFEAKRAKSLQKDYARGCKSNDEKPRYLFASDTDFAALRERHLELSAAESAAIQELHERAIQLSNEVDEKDKLTYTMALESGRVAPVSLEDLLPAFIQKNGEGYRKLNPYLSDAAIQELHNLVGTLLIKGIDLQHTRAKIVALEEVIQNPESDASLQKLGEILDHSIAYDVFTFPEFLVFEWIMKVRIRSDQMTGINQMLGLEPTGGGFTPDLLLQKMMAGGKTFIWGTLLTQLKADGHHLSILVPPASLFETNAQDMQMRTDKIFGQTTHTLLFHRGPHQFNPQFLGHVYNTLIRAIEERDSVILPPDALQSLQNQYLDGHETLAKLYQEYNQSGKRRDDIKKQIDQIETSMQILKKILLLIKERGVLTLDEVDVTLSARKEDNFPIGDHFPIPKHGVELIGELYLIAATDSEIQAAGLDLMGNRQGELTESQYEEVKTLLAKKVLERLKESQKWNERLFLSPSQIDSLLEYLLDPKKAPPPFVDALFASGIPEKIQAADWVVLLKLELNSWLKSSWQKSAFQHYGFSQQNKEKEYAIPYSANRTPNERSEFADPWEMVNRTIHLYLCQGLTETQAKRFVENLQQRCRNEWAQMGGEGLIGQAPTATRFFAATGLELMRLNPEHPASIQRVVEASKKKQEGAIRLVMEYALDFAIPQYEVHAEQIHNNGQNLASMGKVLQGYTGTVENRETFPDAIHTERDKGTNGKIIDVLLRKNDAVHVVKENKPQEILRKIIGWPAAIHKGAKQFRALIDLGPLFKGVDSETVAREILAFYTTHPDESLREIQGVLYWDDQTQMLSCIKKGEEHPIVLSLTDPESIYSATRLRADELFAFYPHHKLTGADLKLPPDARALATVTENTPLRDLLQGCMRMRELFDAQHVEMVVPEPVVKLIAEVLQKPELIDTPDSLLVADLIPYTESHEAAMQKVDLLRSVFQKIAHVGREYALEELYQESGEEENRLYQKRRGAFVRPQSLQLYQEHGRPAREVPTVAFLLQSADQILLPLIQKRLRDVISSKGEILVEEGVLSPREIVLCQEIHTTIKKALPKLPRRISNRVNLSFGREATVEQAIAEKQTVLSEQQTEYTVELDIVQSVGDLEKAAEETEWKSFHLVEEAATFPTVSPYPESVGTHPPVWRLVELMQEIPHLVPYAKCFPGTLLVTQNFLETVKGGKNVFDRYQKGPIEVLVSYDPETNSWTTTLLTIQEGAFFKEALHAKKMKQQPHWILEPDGTLIQEGSTSLEALSKEAQGSLQEALVPVLALAGDVLTLNTKKWRRAVNAWALNERQNKHTLLEAFILEDSDGQDQAYRGSYLEALLNKWDESADQVQETPLSILKLGLLAVRNRRVTMGLKYLERVLPTINEENKGELILALSLAQEAIRGSRFVSQRAKAKGHLLRLITVARERVEGGDEDFYKHLLKLEGFNDPAIQKEIFYVVESLIVKGAYAKAAALAKIQIQEFKFYNPDTEKRNLPSILQIRALTLETLRQLSNAGQIEHVKSLTDILVLKMQRYEYPGILEALIKVAKKSEDTPIEGIQNLTDYLRGSEKAQIKTAIDNRHQSAILRRGAEEKTAREIVGWIDQQFLFEPLLFPDFERMGLELYDEFLKNEDKHYMYQARRSYERKHPFAYILPTLEEIIGTGSPHAKAAVARYVQQLKTKRSWASADEAMQATLEGFGSI